MAAMLAVQPSANAQGLAFSLFGRYLDSLREQAGIPGLSAVISQNGNVVWSAGFGRQSADAALSPNIDTPYPIGGLSQTFGATLLLKKCIDESYAELSDTVTRWHSRYPEPATTLRQLLSHTAPTGGFRYDLSRFSALTPVVEECAHVRYPSLLANEIFNRFVMTSSVPGHALVAPTLADRELFPAETLERYADIIGRIAAPHRVDSRGRASRTEIAPVSADVSTGIVSTAGDLARFDAALGAGVLLTPESRLVSSTQAISLSTPLPTGLGWFVQNHNNQPIVWQFGMISGGYSSLIIKAPNRGTTLILLANSDGLSAPFSLEQGDVTTSPFAQLFLRLLVP